MLGQDCRTNPLGRLNMILDDLAKPRPLGFHRRTYKRPKSRRGPTNIKIPNERGEMNLILNRLKLLDRRRQQEARIRDRIDAITPCRISISEELSRLPLAAKLLDRFIRNQMLNALLRERSLHRGRIIQIDVQLIRPDHHADLLAETSSLFFGPP